MGNKKRFTWLLIGTLILSLVIAGCGEKKDVKDKEQAVSPSETATAESTEPSAYALPLVEPGSVTLSFATYDNHYAPKSYAQNLPVWQEIEKNTGVKIKWDVSPNAQYSSAMNIRLAAASDLPDIINLPSNPVKLSHDGVIIPLDELIDKYAPNIKKFYADNPDIYKMAKAPDGHIYSLSSVTSGAAYTDPLSLLIRKDWLDKLNLKEPTTLDEWYTVLKAIKEGDPNENGKPDEIPLSPPYSWLGSSIFGNALGLHLSFYSLGYSIDDNGKVQYDWLNPKAEEMIVWLNKLYSEGLLDPEFMTKKDDKILADVSRELIGSTVGFLNATEKYNSSVTSGKAEWINVVPPAEAGQKGFYEKYGPISGHTAISKDSKNPEIAIKWLDYIYASEEGARLVAMGIEGKSYTMEGGKPKFTEFITNNPDGLDPSSALRSIGAYPVTPWIRTDKGVYAESSNALLQLNPKQVEMAEKLKPYLIDAVPLEFILPSAEEVNDISRIGTDIPTYLEEAIVKFIVGREPIDWGKFTGKLKDLGIDKLIEIKQQQYDRFIKE
ncbi:extracellular solute-binding protein [Paenibacillus eucommiae]|uniref:Aldouronate transport system substrate-binding protein n=1 Tax=Paenibacillus eucommiae TaxID=1355755 RepID=A0ABS4IT49_9BACL|nr:extracellular solute-binding protein [Paenibacillus eucommiae]MBP1990747.1 putative aldouronate transport system substrate-binding protein [Paenibacillus eucommiae]